MNDDISHKLAGNFFGVRWLAAAFENALRPNVCTSSPETSLECGGLPPPLKMR